MTFAAILGDVDTMKTLLQRGLPVNTADYDGRTTLHLAALEGNVKVLEVLLQNGADPMVRDRSACGRNMWACLSLLCCGGQVTTAVVGGTPPLHAGGMEPTSHC